MRGYIGYAYILFFMHDALWFGSFRSVLFRMSVTREICILYIENQVMSMQLWLGNSVEKDVGRFLGNQVCCVYNEESSHILIATRNIL
jgi:hypothetical protein